MHKLSLPIINTLLEIIVCFIYWLTLISLWSFLWRPFHSGVVFLNFLILDYNSTYIGQRRVRFFMDYFHFGFFFLLFFLWLWEWLNDMIIFSILFSHQFNYFLHRLIRLLLVPIVLILIFESGGRRAILLSFWGHSPFAGMAGIFCNDGVFSFIVFYGVADLLLLQINLDSQRASLFRYFYLIMSMLRYKICHIFYLCRLFFPLLKYPDQFIGHFIERYRFLIMITRTLRQNLFGSSIGSEIKVDDICQGGRLSCYHVKIGDKILDWIFAHR